MRDFGHGRDKYRNIIEDIKMQVGKDKVICGLSGGVDSAVTAALINSAIGKNLICVFVDTGLMRENEGKEIKNLLCTLLVTRALRGI